MSKYFIAKNFLGLAVLAVSLTVFLACSDENSSSSSSKSSYSSSPSASSDESYGEEAIKVTAVRMMDDYNENGVSADSKYKGKLIEVTGTVDDISKDILGDLYVTLLTDEMMFDVQCYFKKEHTESLGALKKGQGVVIRGKGTGAMGNVTMEKCEIVNTNVAVPAETSRSSDGMSRSEYEKNAKELDNAIKELDNIQIPSF